MSCLMERPGLQHDSLRGCPVFPYFWCHFIYPLVMTNIAIENGPFIIDLPTKSGDFQQLCKRLPEGTF